MFFFATDHPTAFKNVTVITAHSSEAASVIKSSYTHSIHFAFLCGKKNATFVHDIFLLLKNNLLFLFSFSL